MSRLTKSDKRVLRWAVYWASINPPMSGYAPLKTEGCPYRDDFEAAVRLAEEALRKIGAHGD
jgi:hypothetical protein